MAWLCLPCSNLGTEGVLFCAAVIHLLFAGWMGRRLHPLRLLPDTTVTAATRRSFYCFWVNGMFSSLVKGGWEWDLHPSRLLPHIQGINCNEQNKFLLFLGYWNAFVIGQSGRTIFFLPEVQEFSLSI
ncbi:hypothetical protein BRADI_1g12715v3 [Brachypodium distachyon]|uniref:Uncharacterized protein n=1 Tax=Brachypodium distachyon TaxID=15368 RepID=A0A0Q3GSK9_BRADI|nr:hypothetical protein BRADI_1g12715v3 [Brachypodium distachyon]